jgi:hypothetical protein
VDGGFMEKLTEQQLDQKIHAFLSSRFEAYPDIEANDTKPTRNFLEGLQAFIKKALHRNLPQQAS